jgi:hypothetical protein
MLDDQENQDDLPTQEKPDEVHEAWVARTRSGSDHYNTLTPRWDFAFSV